jgi:hypothetical protein
MSQMATSGERRGFTSTARAFSPIWNLLRCGTGEPNGNEEQDRFPVARRNNPHARSYRFMT